MGYERKRWEAIHYPHLAAKDDGRLVFGLVGGYYFDRRKRRYVKAYGSTFQSYLKSLCARSLRSEVKRRIKAEEYDSIPDCRGHYDMWYWE